MKITHMVIEGCGHAIIFLSPQKYNYSNFYGQTVQKI